MIKMMIMCVMAFTLCWLPFNTLLVVGDQYPDIYLFSHINYIWFGCHFLAMSHACYNPLIYVWMNARFRSGFAYVLRFLPCIPRPPVPPDFLPHCNATVASNIHAHNGHHKINQHLAHREGKMSDVGTQGLKVVVDADGCSSINGGSSDESSPTSNRNHIPLHQLSPVSRPIASKREKGKTKVRLPASSFVDSQGFSMSSLTATTTPEDQTASGRWSWRWRWQCDRISYKITIMSVIREHLYQRIIKKVHSESLISILELWRKML